MLQNDPDRLTLSDDALVTMARQGDSEAFGELIVRYRQKCVNLATYFLRNRGDAEDEAQNAFSQALKHLEQYQGDAEFSTWLSRIVVNQCLALMRSRRRAQFVYLDEPAKGQKTLPVELPAAGPDPEGELAYSQMLAVLQREIRCIPPALRKVMELRDIQELPMMEVAEQLGITVPAAKSRLLRARLELRSRLSRHYQGGGNSALLSRCAAPFGRVAHHCTVRVR
jgi:RNA polymerase sigma-70 factor, ECF subfamily